METLRAAVPADTDGVSALLARSYPALMAGYYEADVLALALPLMTRAQPALMVTNCALV